LVTPCDTANADPTTNQELVNELIHNRKQRDDCAARVDGVATWRTQALARAAKAAASATVTK